MNQSLQKSVYRKHIFQMLTGWAFGIAIFIIGILNIVLVHLVPGVVYLLLSFLYFPSFNLFVKEKTGITIHWVIKILLGIILIIFTLGVSDLGDMID